MNEMMSYIFGTLQKNEAALTNVAKALKAQSKFNKNLTIFVLAGTVYVYVSERRRKEQEKKIKQLREELDKLMNKEAEEEVDAGEQ